MRSKRILRFRWLIALVALNLVTLTVAIIFMNTPGTSNLSCSFECTTDEEASDPLANVNFDDGLTKRKRISFVRRQIMSTVSIYTDNYTHKKGLRDGGGTGVVIDEDGTVLTAWHVVDEAEFIQVAFQKLLKDDETVDETRYIPMYVDKFDKAIDSAILKPLRKEELLPPPMPLSFSWEPKRGDLLWHFGSTTMWAQGKIRSTKFMHLLLPITAKCVSIAVEGEYGDSGGPVVTPKGSLVGILVSISTANKDAVHYVPITTIVETLGLTCY